MIDKEVNGEAAKDDNQTRIFLTENMGTTYPDNARISEDASPNEALVPDTENDNDFGSANAVKYPTDTTYDYNKEDVDDFDGINDAINRIVAKLNQLTININGEDDIKKNPKKLDFIRGTLVTLLRDVYSDGSVDDVENGIYVKKGLSRIDKILQDLYNFDLTYGATRAKVNTYNGKDLYGVENNESASTEMIDSFSSRSPEKIEDIFGKASILDVIIELLSGNENDLVKTKLTPWKDLENNENNWKVNADNTVATTYDNTTELTNNKNSRNYYTVLQRLDDIEKALTLMFSRFANKTNFTKDVSRVGEGAYSGVTSIDDYMRFLRDNSGLCFHGTGLYADKVENDERTTAAKAITAENWVNPVHGTVSGFDAYDVIYDAIKRIKNSEMNLSYNNAKLGTDYDTYKATKDDYEALAPNDNKKPTLDYTVTSDMRAVLKLLYGSDLYNVDTTSNNKTGSVHFNVADENNDNFKNSPGGVSVIDELYKMLYKVPQAYEYNTGTGTTKPLTGTVDNFYNRVIGYDPANPKAHSAVADGESPVADGHRRAFILQSTDGDNAYRKNRIDVLEDWVKAIYRYVGFGSTTDSNYFTGNLHITLKDRDDEEKDVLVNGERYCTAAYSEVNFNANDSYTLVGIALQSYYNTLSLNNIASDIKGRIGTKSTGSPINAENLWKAIEETNVSNNRVKNVNAGLEAADKETVVKNDATEQSGEDIVTPAAMKAYVADMMTQLRSEYEAKCEQVKEQAIILTYLKCSDITVYNNAIKIDRSGIGEDFIWKEGESSLGSLTIGDKEKRFGEEMRRITITDFEDNVEYSAWFKYDNSNIKDASSYKEEFFKISTNFANDASAVLSDNITNANDTSAVLSDTISYANDASITD